MRTSHHREHTQGSYTNSSCPRLGLTNKKKNEEKNKNIGTGVAYTIMQQDTENKDIKSGHRSY